ncbi:hypothetical protein [Neobacillus sp. CF12]|uniref:hypothetical protein n=1 Tax=Neobacillus sp. CF12 TaxID=3055864 RepID=UPI0025A0285D|nr:hypothetical protein [Neobacillus sp. CF12]MDM5329822.1 hypothetical protein [Neobacillus sp. CF12]
MKNWLYTENTILIAGMTEEGLPFFENKLQGWNDEEGTDKEDLVIINAVVYDDGSEMILKNIYTSEEAMENPVIREKSEEVEQILLQEVNLWISGMN